MAWYTAGKWMLGFLLIFMQVVLFITLWIEVKKDSIDFSEANDALINSENKVSEGNH